MDASTTNAQQAPSEPTSPALSLNSLRVTCQGSRDSVRGSLIATKAPQARGRRSCADEEDVFELRKRRPALTSGASARVAPAQQRLDGIHQVPSSERLAQSPDAGGRRPSIPDGSSDEGDGDPLECGVLEDRAGKADAVHVRQDAVDEDHRGGGVTEYGHGLFAAAYSERSMAAALQSVG